MNSMSLSLISLGVICLWMTSYVQGHVIETQSPRCGQNYYACNNSLRCIPTDWTCDQYSDCPNGDDETLPRCATAGCDDHEWRCNNGQCIPSDWKCDEDEDCLDSSDEAVATCPHLHRRRHHRGRRPSASNNKRRRR